MDRILKTVGKNVERCYRLVAKILFFGVYLYLIRLQDPAREKERWCRISKRVEIECYDLSRWHANTHAMAFLELAAGIHVPIDTHKREEEIFKAFNFLFFLGRSL